MKRLKFFSLSIHEFLKDLNVLQNLDKNSEKNKILLKWEKILTDKNKLYKVNLSEQKEKKKKKEMEEKQRLLKIKQEKNLKLS